MAFQNSITLRQTTKSDLETLFLFQLNEEACHLAAFMPIDHTNKEAYLIKFSRLLADPTVNNMTIMCENSIAGSIAKFEVNGKAEITYWLDQAYWNQGIATRALQLFLSIEKMRPVYAHVAFDNYPSQRILEKSGFIKIGLGEGFASKRQAVIEEFRYRLDTGN